MRIRGRVSRGKVKDSGMVKCFFSSCPFSDANKHFLRVLFRGEGGVRALLPVAVIPHTIFLPSFSQCNLFCLDSLLKCFRCLPGPWLLYGKLHCAITLIQMWRSVLQFHGQWYWFKHHEEITFTQGDFPFLSHYLSVVFSYSVWSCIIHIRHIGLFTQIVSMEQLLA